jgi:hypothetical protein
MYSPVTVKRVEATLGGEKCVGPNLTLSYEVQHAQQCRVRVPTTAARTHCQPDHGADRRWTGAARLCVDGVYVCVCTG